MARRTLILLLLSLAIAGCDTDNSDLKAFIAEVKTRKSSDIKPIPQIAEYQPYVYQKHQLRSPFQPFATGQTEQQRASTSGIAPDFDRPRERLEQYPLDALVMLGTLTVGDTRYALIGAPDNVVHRVTVGDHMGTDFGTIVAITNNAVRLIEIVPNGIGGYVKRPAVIAITD